MTSEEQHLHEVKYGRQFAGLNLPNEEFIAWSKAKVTQRYICHYDKIFILWKLFAGEPTTIGRIRMREPKLDSYDGLSVKLFLEYEGEAKHHTVSHMPTAIIPGRLWAHLPYFSEVSYTPYLELGKMVVRYPVIVKTEGGFKIPTEDELLMMPLGEFRRLFPSLKGEYL